MIKSKYLLYEFKSLKNDKYQYIYKTDKKYFEAEKPPKNILNLIDKKAPYPDSKDMIDNPWQEWEQNDTQKMVSDSGVCINYLKTTNNEYIQKQEDLKLLEKYNEIVCHFDISTNFGFDMVKKWHKDIFETIYPFAGELRTVQMSKGIGDEEWTWQLSFLNAIPELDKVIQKVVETKYDDIKTISYDLSVLISDFLFIHPFREGNGRLSRLLSDIILAKNGFPMIGLKLKKGDNYINRVHAGYTTDYKPLAELLEEKIYEEIKNL